MRRIRVRIFLLFFLLSTFFVINVMASRAMEDNPAQITYRKFLADTHFDSQQQGVHLLHDYGAFTLYAVAESSLPMLIADEASTINFAYDMDMLWLDAYPFNTQTSFPPSPSRLEAEALSGESLQLIQFVGPIKQEWLTAVSATGAQLVHYVANNGYLVWTDNSSRAKLDRLIQTKDFLQFNAPYTSHFKIEPTLKQQTLTNQTQDENISITVQMLRHPHQQSTETIIDSLAVITLTPWTSVLQYQNKTITIKASDINKIAMLPDVIWVGKSFEPELLDEVQGQILAGAFDANQTGPIAPGYLDWLSGLNFSQDPNDYPIIDITDDGVGNGQLNSGDYTIHQFGNIGNSSRVAFIENCTADASGGSIDGHGHINVSIAVGYDNRTGFPYQDSNGYNRGLGINPFGRVGATRIFDDNTSFDISRCDNDFVKLIERSYANGARISSNSWGCAGCSASYDVTSQIYDVATRDAQLSDSGNQELIFIIAAGNTGPNASTINTPANAKNVITVGGSENTRPTWEDGCGMTETHANNAMDMAIFSSRGPAPGGRVKPEIVAPATHIQGTASTHPNYTGHQVCDQYLPAGQTIFASSSGTSHSTPAVAGVTSLYYYWLENEYDLETPSPALIKAYLIAHPTYLTGESANDTLPSNNQGYGMPNLGLAFDDTARLIIDQSEILNNTGEVWQQQVTVADPTKPVRIVMTYTDQAGLVGTSPQVNDLNLTVANNGKQYRGNHFSGQWSAEGGSGDIANNYEAVFLPTNTSGQIDLTITAVQIAGDGVPNFGDETDQDFALVCYNCAVAPDFHLTINPQDIAICQTEKQTNLTIDIASIAGFSEEVALSINNVPSGLSANFAPASVTPPQSSQLTLANIASIPSGSYQMFINGTSADRAHQIPLWLHPVATSPAPIALSKPENGAVDVAINPTFTWQVDDLATASYLEIATDAAFTDVIYSASVQGNSHRLTTIGLNVETTYYWRLTTNNACGERVSTIRQFTTKETWPILLVDDDWGSLYHPILDLNVEGRYLSALSQIGTYFDYWNVEATGTEPDTAVLDQYDAVIWFSGDAYKVFLTPIAGPSAASEPILQSYLNNKHCLLLTSQEYYYDRGLTTFMQEYLGVAQVQDDVSQTSVTGVGDIFGNLGTHPLDGVAGTGTADPDVLIPNALGQVGFIGSSKDAIGVYKETETYKTAYLAFDLADIDHDPMVTILEDFLHWCQGENNLSTDSEFIYLPMVVKR